MLEFTISRTVLVICGMAMLVTVGGFMLSVEDQREDGMDRVLVEDIAEMLDGIRSAGLDSVELDGHSILPSTEHYLVSEKGVLTLHRGEKRYMAVTLLEEDFELGFDTVCVLDLVPEGLGDLPDGVGEDVDLLDAVV